jgi:hypothetical protein
MQIFHPVFWVNQAGQHPVPAASTITPADIEQGVWKVNPLLLTVLAGTTHHYNITPCTTLIS